METFNPNTFIKSLKERYDAIPFIKGDKAAKKMVADSIKFNNFNPAEVLSYICGSTGLSGTLNDAEWKDIFNKAIKGGDLFAKNLDVYMSSLKSQMSYEQMFNLAAKVCDKNPISIKNDLRIDQYGWQKAVESVIKHSEETKVETNEAEAMAKIEAMSKKNVAKKENKPAIKSGKKDPRSQAIVGINIETGERLVLGSQKEWELKLGVGHGTISQVVDGKPKDHIKKGWKLYRLGEEPKNNVKVNVPVEVKKESKSKNPRRSHKSAVMQFAIKDGRKELIATYPSITAASIVTGIPHSSISKCASGVKGYPCPGGFGWEYATA